MEVPTSRANRRRRWWLRALKAMQGELAPVPPQLPTMRPPSTRSVQPSAPRVADDSTELAARYRRDCRVPAQVVLRLRQPWTGMTLRVPLDAPCTLLGTDLRCQIRLADPSVAPLAAAFLWVNGQLACIPLGEQHAESRTLTQAVTPQHRWSWGRWSGHVEGLPPVVGAPAEADELCVEFAWQSIEQRRPSRLPVGLNLIGSHRACGIRLPSGTAAPVQAALVRVRGGLWLIDLSADQSTRVNGHSRTLSALDPGDEVDLGEHRATVSTYWPADVVSAAPVAPFTTSPGSESWQQFLRDQSIRLQQMQQLLANCQSPAGAARRPDASLTAFLRLAAECQSAAAQALTPQSEKTISSGEPPAAHGSALE